VRYTAAEMRQFLVNNYPACFKPKGSWKLPLKVGIHDDILARHTWLTMDEIKAGLKDYTDGPKYLTRCVDGADRFDLDGQPVSKVTLRQEQHSRARLDRLRAEWGQLSKPQTLGDILQEALNQAKDTTVNAPISHSAFLAGTRVDRAPTVLDARSFFETIRTLVLRQSYLGNSEAMQLIEKRDATNVAYGGAQSAAAVQAKSGFHHEMEGVVRELRGGRKIEAIKIYRNATGVGLKEAKDFVESMQGMPGMVVQPAYGVTPSKDYIVLSKTAGSYDSFEDEGRYADLGGAESLAKRVSERSPTTETLLVKVIGRTKSVFFMS
jgi:sRNA-binding protein/ribosomal protein L7/L12